MDALIGLLLLVATIGAFWGTIQLFRKGHRKRGLIYIAGAVCAVAVTGFAVGIKNERDARAAGFASYEEQQAAEEAEQERLIAEMLAQRAEERRAEQARLDAEAREQGYADHAASLAAQALAEQQREEEAARAAEAAAQAAEDERQARMAQKTTGMMDGVLSVLTTNYGFQPPAESVCRDDGYCSLLVGSFDVSIYGNGIAEVRTSTQQPHSEYVGLCAAVFAGISGSDLGFSREAIVGAFNQARQAGRFELDVAGVEIRVSPDLSNLLACRFYKY